MSWTSILQNPTGIQRIYENRLPRLESVHLHEISLNREGPTLKLRFDLPEYPEHPPRKWVYQGFDTVQVELLLTGVQSVSLNGFTTTPVVNIDLSREEEVALEAVSEDLNLRVRAEAALIGNISAYVNV